MPFFRSDRNSSIDSTKSGSGSALLMVQCNTTPCSSFVIVNVSAFGQLSKEIRMPFFIISRSTVNKPQLQYILPLLLDII